jgi:putative membrane protein
MMGFGGWGTIYMIVFWAIIIALAVWLLSRLFPNGTDDTSSPRHNQTGWRDSVESPSVESPSVESPIEVLKRRYARGEITKMEYEEIRQDLET